jgi:hypothetical protein
MLGRLPAETAAELQAMVKRIRDYENADHCATNDWSKKTLLIADDPDSGGNFTSASDLFAGYLPAGSPTQKVYRSQMTTAAARAAITNGWNAGAGLISYLGHSTQTRLASENLLDTTGVAGLRNGDRLPVFAALSCIVGRYERPAQDCLAESLMVRTNGGAIAVWAPSGLSMNYAARRLGDGFFRALHQDGIGVLGEAIRRAKAGYANGSEDRVMLGIVNLLGDPALKIAGACAEARVPGSYVLWRRQNFSAQELQNGLVSGADANPDGDAGVNLAEYAAQSSPRVAIVSDWNGIPRIMQADEDGRALLVQWRRSRSAQDLVYVVERSNDFIHWDLQPASVEELAVADDNNGATETVTTRIVPPAGESFLCIRVRMLAP